MKKLISFLKDNFILVLVLLLFLGTRLFRIDSIPSSAYWDEASIGYNAYSILQTGKDEWEETLPLHFRAFGEFKLPVYVYSVVISEFLFGLNIFAIRLPAVIYGLLAVIGLYLVVLKLTKTKTIALLSSFLFSITPWFLIFSRTGYEATAGLTFFIWAIFFLMKSLENKNNLVVSTVLFVVSVYSYNSFRILTPFVLGPVLLFHLFRKAYVPVLISTILLVGSLFPIYKLYKQDSGLSRLQTVGSNANFIQNYLKNFSSEFLFINGDSNPRSQFPGQSQLYYLDAAFILLGVMFMIRSKNPKYILFLAILLLAPIPAAITKENPHALRAILLSPLLITISAMGIYYFSTLFKNKSNFILVVVVIMYALSFENYFYKFATSYNKLSSSSWQSEYKEIFEKQDSGCVSDEFAQPYIFALFYRKVDPNYFISTRVLNPVSDWGFSTIASFGNYTFPKKCD